MSEGKYGRLFTEDDVLRILRYGADCDWSEILEELDGPDRRGLTFPPDEPLFLLRGQDTYAPAAVSDYLARLNTSLGHREKVAEAHAGMLVWQAGHPDRVKVPD